MTIQEFMNLKIDDIVSPRFQENGCFRIDDTEVFGEKPKVCSGIQIVSVEQRYIRIDIGNCGFWNLVGRIKK